MTNKNHLGYHYLQTVLNRTGEAFLLLNTTGMIKQFNDNAVRIVEQFTGSDISLTPNLIDALPQWRREDVKKAIARCLENELVEYEVQYPGEKWLNVSFFPLYNDDGSIEYTCCIIRDFTQKKLEGERLRKSEALHRSLFDSMMEGVVFQSTGENQHMANQSAADILKLSKDHLVRFGLLSPYLCWFDRREKEVDLEKQFCPQLKQKQPVRNLVLAVKRRNVNEKPRWLMLNAEPVSGDALGKLAGCVVTFTDITESIRNREERSLLSKVIRETSNIVVITDADEKINWVNKSFESTTGYSLREAVGRKPGHLLKGPGKDPREVQKIKTAIQKGRSVAGEILNYTKDGEAYWATYNIHPVKDEQGNVIKFFSIQSDITELKRIQQEIVAQQLAHQEQLNLAAIAAQEEKQTEIGQELHDNVNQILAATKMYLAPIENGSGNYREKAAMVGRHIQMAIDEIRKLSHQLVAPRFREGSLTEVFDRLVKNLPPGVSVQSKIEKMNEDELSPHTKLALYRIAQEQISNINKYARCKKVKLVIEREEGKIRMVIEDNGQGFDTTAKRSGIGINNIYNRAESLCGSAEIQSAPGQGCRLRIELPLLREAVVPPAPLTSPIPPSAWRLP